MILTRFISSPIANVFNVFEEQKTQLILNIARVILVVLVFWGSSRLFFSPVYTIGLYSSCMTLYYGIMTIIVLRVIRKNQ